MNGRIYDPTLGRFLQADPHIQAPMNSQNYNRYSYVLNNPLSYTDPSGYFFTSLFKGVRKFVKKHWRSIVSIGLTIWAPWGTGFWASVATGAAAGAITTGSLRGALTGALTAGMFHGIGSHFQGLQDSAGVLSAGARAGKVLAHGFAGGISSVLNGGKFGHGFASAGFTQALAGAIDKIGGRIGNITKGDYFSTANRTMRIMASAVVGGTASAISGGKFANGAVTGAFSRGFNDEAHFQQDRESFFEDFISRAGRIFMAELQIIGGAASTVAGGAMTATGWWAPIGIPLSMHGTANVQEGIGIIGRESGLSRSQPKNFAREFWTDLSGDRSTYYYVDSALVVGGILKTPSQVKHHLTHRPLFRNNAYDTIPMFGKMNTGVLLNDFYSIGNNLNTANQGN